MLSPIVVFAYNRPHHLRRTLEALSKNDMADQSLLYVFCDGPKNNVSPEQLSTIHEVRSVAREKQWCRSVTVIESKNNKGLADSIVDGVTSVVEEYGRVIVLEDDIVTSRGFLRYMNDALDMYEQDEQVMHISAYMYPHKQNLPETFFYEVPYPGGGWATWKRAWSYFSNDIEELYAYWSSRWKVFNIFGGDYLQRQLEANKNGSMYTWFIKWHAVLLRMGGLTLYPGTSLTNNIGFDNSGTNCGTMNKFDISHPAEYIEVKRIKIKENKRAARIIYHFYSGHWYSKRYRKKWLSKITSLFRRKK